MAGNLHAYEDFSVGHEFPPYYYCVEAADNDAFIGTFDHEPVKHSNGIVVLDPEGNPSVRAAHPTLVGSFQPQHAAFSWPVGVLHAKEKVSLLATVYPGEALKAIVTIKDKYIKNDKRFVVLEITSQKQETGKVALVVERTLVWPH
ncbi:MAG: hypothetical protein CVU22_00960 [Betaproteobacteria bacterium HGW-Betaproteobacteria-16]|nr:MAG: hypothetical protein CVU22_00960 [Betaproteobacteria bacterium HGW-Betaproteobacteria-16]